jgi:hypothetical protein
MPSTPNLFLIFLVNLAGAFSAISMLVLPVAAVNQIQPRQVAKLYAYATPVAIILALAFYIA